MKLSQLKARNFVLLLGWILLQFSSSWPGTEHGTRSRVRVRVQSAWATETSNKQIWNEKYKTQKWGQIKTQSQWETLQSSEAFVSSIFYSTLYHRIAIVLPFIYETKPGFLQQMSTARKTRSWKLGYHHFAYILHFTILVLYIPTASLAFRLLRSSLPFYKEKLG